MEQNQFLSRDFLTQIIKKLGAQKCIFCSEDDFKFQLAWMIKEHVKNIEIRLEYPTENENGKMEYIDIMIIKDDFCYPIELKYKTSKLETKDISLKKHSAKNLSCYDCLKDIARIESFRSHTKLKFKYGYAIWLTNDMSYKNKAKQGCDYYEFSVHQDAKIPKKMSWKYPTNKGERKYPIKIKGDYKINWEDYCAVDESENAVFEYALINVG